MSVDWFDRQGNPMTFEDYLERMSPLTEQQRMDYKRVAQTQVGPYWISTVWLGLDHGFDGKKRIIFETMVFDRPEDDNWVALNKVMDPSYSEFAEIECQRYSTEEEALAGHAEIVEKYRKETGDSS